MPRNVWVWGRAIILFGAIFCFLRAIQYGYAWLIENYAGLLAWADLRPNLSGWAQAVGGTVAIFIAIFVPAYQRYTQNLDRRREDAARHYTLSLGCFYVLGDIGNYLRRLIHLDNAARNRVGDATTVMSLLTRIDTLERRETDWQRATMLYHARNHLLLAEGMTKVGSLDLPLDDSSRVLLRDYEVKVQKLQDQAQIDNAYCGQVVAKMNCHILARAIYHLPKNKAQLPK